MPHYLESEREFRWHHRFVWPVTAAAILSIPVVIWKIEWLAWLVWLTFLAEDVVMLTIVRRKGAWLAANWFETGVLVLTFPLWHDLLGDLFALELAGALRIIEVLKLVKAGRVLHRNLFARRTTPPASRAQSD
jgi:hypothetical protein